MTQFWKFGARYVNVNHILWAETIPGTPTDKDPRDSGRLYLNSLAASNLGTQLYLPPNEWIDFLYHARGPWSPDHDAT